MKLSDKTFEKLYALGAKQSQRKTLPITIDAFLQISEVLINLYMEMLDLKMYPKQP